MTTDKLSSQAVAAGRNGYAAKLLGQRVEPPTIDEALQGDTVHLDGLAGDRALAERRRCHRSGKA